MSRSKWNRIRFICNLILFPFHFIGRVAFMIQSINFMDLKWEKKKNLNWKLQHAMLSFYKYTCVHCNRIINKQHKSFEYLNNSICEERSWNWIDHGCEIGNERDTFFYFLNLETGWWNDDDDNDCLASSQDKFSRPINWFHVSTFHEMMNESPATPKSSIKLKRQKHTCTTRLRNKKNQLVTGSVIQMTIN